MENQHQKITGYRDLSEIEIGLMNSIKEAGARFDNLLSAVDYHLVAQKDAAIGAEDHKAELARIAAAEPLRWKSIARTHMQEALMALTRAVAQPSSF